MNSSFDGMVDCVMPVEGDFAKQDPEKLNLESKNSLGLTGLWFVGSSSDYFSPFADKNFIGYYISNCCGESIVAMKKLYQ